MTSFRILIALMERDSEVLTAAVDAFFLDKKIEDLIETLLIIAAHTKGNIYFLKKERERVVDG